MTSCIIFNPSAARGRARRKLEDLRRLLGPDVDFRPTQHPGHAEELALEAARAGFATVAAAGGDGTVHEVANGLLRADRPDITFAVIPLGSANDYAFTLARWTSGGCKQKLEKIVSLSTLWAWALADSSQSNRGESTGFRDCLCTAWPFSGHCVFVLHVQR